MSMAEEASDKLISHPPLPTDALLELLLTDAYIDGRGGRQRPQWGPVQSNVVINDRRSPRRKLCIMNAVTLAGIDIVDRRN